MEYTRSPCLGGLFHALLFVTIKKGGGKYQKRAGHMLSFTVSVERDNFLIG
jgi:hypothetical protein